MAPGHEGGEGITEVEKDKRIDPVPKGQGLPGSLRMPRTFSTESSRGYYCLRNI